MKRSLDRRSFKCGSGSWFLVQGDVAGPARRRRSVGSGMEGARLVHQPGRLMGPQAGRVCYGGVGGICFRSGPASNCAVIPPVATLASRAMVFARAAAAPKGKANKPLYRPRKAGRVRP